MPEPATGTASEPAPATRGADMTDPATMAMPPSASTLVYAFSDRFLGTEGRIGVDRVKMRPDQAREVPETLFGIAFGSLMRRGRLSVTKVERKKLFIRTESLITAPAPGATAEAEPKSSLEFDLLRAAIALKKEPTVRDVVRAIFGKTYPDPWSQALEYPLAAMLRRGLVHVETFERGERRFVWDLDLIDPFAADAATAWADHQSWRTSEPLADDILTGVHMGFLFAKESDERDDD